MYKMNAEDLEQLDRIFNKIEEQMRSDQISFLCQVEISDEDLHHLRSSFDYLLRGCSSVGNVNNQITRRNNLLMSILLVNCAFYSYDESGFWANFEKWLDCYREIPYKNRKTIYDCFNRVIDYYEISINTIVEGEETNYVNNILMQTFVPKSYLPSFFNFIYNIFDNVWDGCVPENLHESFEDLAFDFRNVDLDSGYLRDEAIGSVRLIRSTRRVMRDANAFGPIVERIIRRFESNNLLTDDTYLGRFEEDFNVWYNQNREIIKRSRSERRRYSKFYLDSNNTLHLRIPAQSVSKEVVNAEFIFSDGDSFSKTISAYRQNGVYRIDDTDLGRSLRFFKQIIVKLDGKMISPGLGSDSYIIFDSAKEQIPTPTEGTMYLAVKAGIIVYHNDV